MATIHNIDILLGARTEGLDKGLDRSKSRVTGFQRQVEVDAGTSFGRTSQRTSQGWRSMVED